MSNLKNELLERSMDTDPSVWPIFSYSQLSSWDRCEKAWHFGYDQKWKSDHKSDALNIGTLIHVMLKIYYDNIHDKTLARSLIDDFLQEVLSQSSDKDLPAISRAAYCVTMYFEWAPKVDQGHRILKTEHHFTIPFVTGKGRNFVIQGYIDLLTEYNNRLWIWDHKSMEGQFWTPVEVQMDPQTPFYGVCLRKQGINSHGMYINMLNTYDYKNKHKVEIEKLFRRESCYRTDKELDSYETEMKFLVDDLLENNQTPRRSLRRDCKNCSFHEPCLMDLKKINPEPFLQAKFSQKESVEVELHFEPDERLIIQHG